jgi:anti-sigma factor RsiW
MKCDDCLNFLEEYIDSELLGDDFEQVSNHLVVCQQCSNELELLSTEKEVYARYDRELEIAPSMWQTIAARTAAESRPVASPSPSAFGEWFAGLFAAPRFRYAFSGAMAVSIIAAIVGVMYLRIHQPQQRPGETLAHKGEAVTPANQTDAVVPPPSSRDEVIRETGPGVTLVKVSSEANRRVMRKAADDPGVIEDIANSELTKRDTAEHIQQAENLLRTIRSLQAEDDAGEIDVTYEKAMSRRLLSENEVLRKDAEAAGKFPTRELLTDLEPFLIEIANLPDKTTATRLSELKERVQKTEIVAALVSYDD